VDRALERCGLQQVPRRTIGTLSKGFQQRVGIAQATIGDPEILILDEPTLGLDPKQIIEIRQLIRDLGGEKTVLLSSHILPEVSQVCNRVIIINRGRLVADDTPENLRSRLATSSVVRVALRNEGDALARAARDLAGIPGVITVDGTPPDRGTGGFAVTCAPAADLRETIARALVEAGLPLIEIYREELSLEEIFLQLVTEEVSPGE
jgi:gliding motility-associated transport system ATP-binding protein